MALPDPIFLAILHAALESVRDAELVQFRTRYRPSRAARRGLDEYHEDGYPDLAPLFSRRQLVRVIDRLLKARREEARRRGCRTPGSPEVRRADHQGTALDIADHDRLSGPQASPHARREPARTPCRNAADRGWSPRQARSRSASRSGS